MDKINCMIYNINLAASIGKSLDYSIILPEVVNYEIDVDLLEPAITSFGWASFEWRSLECDIDVYTVICIDEKDAVYKIDFNGKIITESSLPCAGFVYDVENKKITSPLILTMENIYIGTYKF